jgi:hypothetical protein
MLHSLDFLCSLAILIIGVKRLSLANIVLHFRKLVLASVCEV